MNQIQLEWQHIKKDEVAGKMFDDELEHLPKRSFREWKLEEKEETPAHNG